MDSNKLDYGEIFCTAVDQIITKKLEELEYDITKLCTVVDDTHRNQGKYVVSDGAIRFEAYSTDNSFRNGNNVLVLIPNGDYNMQKTIQGRVAAADTTPFKYTSPMDTMIKITNNIFDSGKAIKSSGSLLANENNISTKTENLYSISESGQFAGFTRLGITADFRTWLNGLDVTEGLYGLRILIFTDVIATPGLTRENIYELNFSSADMIGNPYQFESYFTQEKVFDISNINNIKKIDVQFYQNGKFYDGNQNYIAWQTQDNLLGPQRMSDNLFVDDIKIYLGYEAGRFTDETLMLYTPDSLTYQYNRNSEINNNNKTISLRWIHKIDDNTYELLNGRNLSDNYKVYWFRYNPGYDLVNEYGGKDWETLYPWNDTISTLVSDQAKELSDLDIKNFNSKYEYEQAIQEIIDKYTPLIEEEQNKVDSLNPFEITFTPDPLKREEKIKAVGIILDEDKKSIYYSDLLIFQNEEDVPDDTTKEALTALQIVCLDGTDGNYFLYDQNGAIKNPGEGQEYLRTVEAHYLGAKITSSLGHIDYLKWYFPSDKEDKDSYTMILSNIDTNEYLVYKGVDCVVSTKKEIDAAGQLDTRQTYSIKNYYNITDSNNIVRCVLSLNGVEYEATKEFNFGEAGTNGSNATFTLNFASNDTALLAVKDSTITVKADLFDASGRRVGFPAEEGNKIKWSWFKYTDNFPYIEDIEENKTGVEITLKYKGNSVPNNDNYYILKAVYNNGGESYNLEAYLPIPIKTSPEYTQFEGARSVIYNNAGTPTYYPHEYKLHEYIDGQHREIKNLRWDIVCDEQIEVTDKDEEGNDVINNKLTQMTKSLLPQLKDSNVKLGYKTLSASTFFASGLNDKVCISCFMDDKILWSQPILILQSQYDFAMLNAWDGSLTIDEKSDTILAAMIGAGRKNPEDNTFSGVLLGDIRKGTQNVNDSNNLTGLYGYHHGVQSFSLTEDGKATFGKANRGQILIDGNESTIQSASRILTNDGTGMKIDLDDGIIDIIEGANETARLTLTSKNNTTLINVDKSNYYLQSDKYSETNGMKIDLTNGKIQTAGAYGKILINPNSPYLQIQGLYNSSFQNLMYIDTNSYYLQSADYSDDDKKGMHINLKNGKIIGYNLYLAGYNSAGKSIVIDSGATYPLKIGSNFYVDYNGNLVCDGATIKNAKILTANIEHLTGTGNQAININDNFYVSGSGHMTANGASINGSVSAGGLSAGSVKISDDQIKIGTATLTGTTDMGLNVAPGISTPQIEIGDSWIGRSGGSLSNVELGACTIGGKSIDAYINALIEAAGVQDHTHDFSFGHQHEYWDHYGLLGGSYESYNTFGASKSSGTTGGPK